jgi:hypothetical protein
VSAKIPEENRQKCYEGDTPDRFGQQLQGKEVEQYADDRRCRQPAKRNQQSAAAAILGVVGADHSGAAA